MPPSILDPPHTAGKGRQVRRPGVSGAQVTRRASTARPFRAERAEVIKQLRKAAKAAGVELETVVRTNQTGIVVGRRSTLGRHAETDDVTARELFDEDAEIPGQGWWPWAAMRSQLSAASAPGTCDARSSQPRCPR